MNRDQVLLWTALALALGLQALATMYGLYLDGLYSWEAGLRAVAGQQVYLDFEVPYGPVSGWLMAGFMLITPSGGWAVLLASMLLNLAATALIAVFVWQVTSSRHHAALAALFTAAWFCVQFGAFYHHHLAYVLVLAGGIAAQAPRPSLGLRTVLAAVAFTFAFHAHQTIGVLGPAAYGLALLLSSGRSAWPLIWRMASAYVLAQALFLLLCIGPDRLLSYWQSTYALPLEWAAQYKSPWRLLLTLFLPYTIQPWTALTAPYPGQILFLPVVGIHYAVYLTLALRWRRLTPALRLALIFASLSSLWCGTGVWRFYTEVTFASGAALVLVLFVWRGRLTDSWGAAIAAAFVALSLVFLGHRLLGDAGLDRSPYFADSALAPLQIRQQNFPELSLADLDQVYRYLRDRPGQVVALDDVSALVPLALGRASPDLPLLYYDGLSIPVRAAAREAWQQRWIASLEATKATYIIDARAADSRPERHPYSGQVQDNMYASLTQISAYLDGAYSPAFSAGGIRLLRRNK